MLYDVDSGTRGKARYQLDRLWIGNPLRDDIRLCEAVLELCVQREGASSR